MKNKINKLKDIALGVFTFSGLFVVMYYLYPLETIIRSLLSVLMFFSAITIILGVIFKIEERKEERKNKDL